MMQQSDATFAATAGAGAGLTADPTKGPLAKFGEALDKLGINEMPGLGEPELIADQDSHIPMTMLQMLKPCFFMVETL